MQVSKKVRDYFENEAHLKTKFSAYSGYLLTFYKEVVKEAPDLADELIDRFENIKVHLFEATENHYLGKNRRVAHNGKYQSSIKLLTNDYVNRDAEKYKRLENFYHEMLHAVIGVRLGQWNEENLIPVPWKNDFQCNVGKPCAMLGNINFDLYSETADFESYFASGVYANLIEEGVVEDWATDLFVKTFPNDEYAKNNPAVDRVTYTVSTMLCGLWNSVSGNQLRKEFLTGVSDGSKTSQQTELFKDAMYELSKTLDFRAKGGDKRKAQEFDVPNICNQYKIENC